MRNGLITGCTGSRKAEPKADLRAEITAWRLLVWAYADERARFANASLSDGADLLVPSLAQRDIAEVAKSAGGVAWMAVDVAADALAVDRAVLEICGGDYHLRNAIARAAERRQPIVPVSSLPQPKPVPRLKINGRLDLGYQPKSHTPFVCWLYYDGTDPVTYEQHAVIHGLFCLVLLALPRLAFDRWIVV